MRTAANLWEHPSTERITLIAGWRQWADAGCASSGLPQYLIERTNARKIGEIDPAGFYVFQVPGTHDLFRPEVKLKDGYRISMGRKRNDFYYTGDARRGLLIFLGDEPQLNAETYAEAFLDIAQEVGIQRAIAVAGVYGAMPYDKDRQISCVYSLRRMKMELEQYALRFSNYEGGATICTFMVDRAEPRGVEFAALYAMVPAYDFGQSQAAGQGLRIENDFKAWYDLMVRIEHLCDLGLDLTDLERRSEQVLASMRAEIDELDRKMPQLRVRRYLEKVDEQFTEMPFVPIGDVWEKGLRDIFGDMGPA
jgi:proteasome assembly chaperone (PAC2) family protein